MKMPFAIFPKNETWTASAFELATEVFVCHGNLHKAVRADSRSYQAHVAAGFYNNVADGLSLMAVDCTESTVMGVLILRDFITLAPPQLEDPRYAPLRRSPVNWSRSIAVTARYLPARWHW